MDTRKQHKHEAFGASDDEKTVLRPPPESLRARESIPVAPPSVHPASVPPASVRPASIRPASVRPRPHQEDAGVGPMLALIVAAMAVGFGAAAAWKQFLQTRGIPQREAEPTSMRTLIAMGCVFATAILAPPTYTLVTGNARGDVPVMSRETPVHLADQIERLQLSGNVAAPMDWADYLIYMSHGRLKPMIYGHIHLSRVETFEDYRRIFRGEQDWLETLQEHDIRYLLVSRGRFKHLVQLVGAESRASSGRLRIVYQDQNAILDELTAGT